MFNVVKEQQGEVLVARLVGSIEESVNFESLIGPVGPELHVNARQVPRINSIGVKAWIKYFSMLQQKGTKLRFQECSTAIVEQINLISNFTCGGAVDSIYVPFSCSKCKAEVIALFQTEDLKKVHQNLPEVSCPKCSGKAIFDDIPEEYFAFISR